MSKEQTQLLTRILLVVIAMLALVTTASIAMSSAYFTHNYVGAGWGWTGSGGTWDGPMAFTLTDFNSNGYAIWDVNGAPAAGTVMVYYTCTGTPSFDNGYSHFEMGDGVSAYFDNALCNGAVHTSTLTYTSNPAQFEYAGQWYSQFSMVITQITINGDDYYNPARIATPIPQGAMPCITATVAVTSTVIPTLTPMYHTGTPPTPTRTPSPTLTPTGDRAPSTGSSAKASPTSAPDISYDSNVLTFDSGVAPLSAVGHVNSNDGSNFLQWDSTSGQDGHTGVAMAHAYMAEEVITSTTETMNAVAVFKPGGYIFPIGITWWARTAYTLTVDATHAMRVWYLDPDYDGNGTETWVAVSTPKQVSNVWREFGAVIEPHGGSGQMIAIGFSDSYVTPHFASLNPCPNGQHGCLYLDDIRVTYGAANALQFQTCGDDGTNGTGNRSGKVCNIAVNTIDVYAGCVQPALLTDIGGWISWIWCRVGTYFTFLDSNRAQLIAMQASQNEVEPFGSVAELGGVFNAVSFQLDAMQQKNRTTGAVPFNFSTMMDLSALDRQPDLHIVTTTSYDYLSQCPAELIDQNSTAMRGACMSVYLLRTTPAVQMIQWVLNGGFLIMLIYVIINMVHNLSKA